MSVAISNITFVGNTVTVTTATNHGLVANQGFSVTSVTPVVYNVNCTVATVPLSTTFTFFLSAPIAYVSGGSVAPAKEVIMMNTSVPSGQSGQTSFRYLLWLTTGTPVYTPGITSAWFGASTQENAALILGNTVEVQRSFTFSSSSTKAEIQAAMLADFTGQQALLAGATQPGQYLGVFYDGVSWSA